MRSVALLVSVAAATAYAQDARKLCRAVVQVQTMDRELERARKLYEEGRIEILQQITIQQPYTLVVTGVCISEREILTPALHPRADLRIVVKYGDGRVLEAKLKGTDPLSNLALIEVPEDSPAFVPIHAAEVAEDDTIGIAGCSVRCKEGKSKFLRGRVKSGHVAIGIQDMYGVTGTGCIVLGSAFAVGTLEGRPNVGSACVDGEGRLVGFVVGGMPPRIVADPDQPGQLRQLELRFALPSSRIARIVDALRRDGRVTRSDFGIELRPVEEALIAQFDLPPSACAVAGLLARPTPDGFAAHDVIVSVDGKSYRDPWELAEALTEKTPGVPVNFEILRRGQRVPLTATPALRKD
jgi:S1-C subfamily serine protease